MSDERDLTIREQVERIDAGDREILRLRADLAVAKAEIERLRNMVDDLNTVIRRMRRAA